MGTQKNKSKNNTPWETSAKNYKHCTDFKKWFLKIWKHFQL